MSDTVIITLINTLGALVTIVITAIVNFRVKKMSEKQEVIHKQINGQESALIELTKKSSKAEGHLEGKEEGKKEVKTEQAESQPKKVIVVNPATAPVIVEPIKKIEQAEAKPTEVVVVNPETEPVKVEPIKKI